MIKDANEKFFPVILPKGDLLEIPLRFPSWFVTLLLVVVVGLAACGRLTNPGIQPTPAEETHSSFEMDGDEKTAETPPPSSEEGNTPEAESVDCPGEERNAIAESIIEKYPEVSYDRVMTWFCDGAEFEDILLALLTGRLSDADPEDMLEDIAAGITWDEIWEELNLTDVIDQE